MRRSSSMRSTTLKAVLKTALSAVAVLLLTAGASFAQSVNLTAAPTTATLPDGQVVPMWGYTCTGTPLAPATCAASNPNALTGWSPVVITVPPGPLTINLTNLLPTTPGATAGIPTSIMIVGQLGGGLGSAPAKTPSPTHAPMAVTWPIAGTNPPAAGAPTFNPPSQSARVQTFGKEVWKGVTTALTWTALKPGTYLIESGTHPSIQGPMGLYGVLVVTTAPLGTTAGTAYPGVTYDKDIPLLLSEIDPLLNTTISKAVNTTGFSETAVWSGQPAQCGNPASLNYLTCYPPVVNYDPRYYLINGVSFDKTHAVNSVFAATGDTAATGTVLVRFVNAGLRMHVPSIVGALTGTPAVPGFSLIAEDGNLLPGIPRIQNEVLLPAGKVYDVMINQPASGTDFPVFDRQLSLSTNNQRDGGMQAYINVNGGALPVAGAFATAVANPDTYSLVAGNTLNVSDPAKGVIANDIGVYGVAVAPTTVLHVGSTLTLNLDGTFTYVPGPGVTSDTFAYMANGNPALTATVTLGACTGTCLGGAPVANPDAYTSSIASRLQIGAPGVLANDTDPAGHPLTAVSTGSVTGGTVTLNADGSFTVVPTTPPTGIATATVTFQYNAVNSQKRASATPATVTVTFNGGSGLQVHVYDAPTYQASLAAGSTTTAVELQDYRWIIEEDRTFNIDPACQVNSATRSAGCPALPTPSLGTSFHTSYMPVVASGCVGVVACESGQTVVNPATGLHSPAVCDLGNGACETTSGQQTPVLPSHVHLDPTKRYYISVLPGDAGNDFSHGTGAPITLAGGKLRPFSITLDCPSGPGGADFNPGTGTCGHGMGGAQIGIGPAQASVKVLLHQTPFPPAKVSVFVFEDDSPLNGENDTEGAATSEPGLGGFEITLFDDAGGTRDATGQMTYDMFNMPLSNSLAGTIDPTTGFDACPISATSTDRLVGMIVTCPNYENGVSSTGAPILSPLRGQAIIANMMPGRYGVVATPGADRIARGEEWLHTNTLDGQKAHDSFMKIGGPGYFQEFGPSGFHVSVGFANPKIINDRLPQVWPTTVVCTSTVTGTITNMRLSRTPDQRIYSSGSNQGLSFTQCYVSLGDPVGEDFAFTKCDSSGKFTLSNLPAGKWRLTVFDQWNDQIVDGHSTPVALTAGATVDMKDIPETNWKTNLSTTTFFDKNGNGVRDANETGLTLVPTNIRFRDGSYSNFNNTDLNGNAGFNEIFPLFNWYVVEADTTRYKQTGVHVVYDAGGPADCTAPAGVTPAPPCSAIAGNLASSRESVHLPANLRVPGAVYCATADCTNASILTGAGNSNTPSTGRIDPPSVTTEGWQGFLGQYSFIEFGKAPFATGENGGIKGEVVYASTRPFDDPTLLVHTTWTPNVPGVTVNLYQEGTAPDGT